ncbi:MAG: ribonuclease R family protein [Terriglobales bacterium]
MVNAQQLLVHIEGLPHRRATLKQLLRELRVKSGERAALRAMLTELVRARRLVAAQHAYEIPASAGATRGQPATAPAKPGSVWEGSGSGSATPGSVTGRISVHREGFAFVLPREGAITAKVQGDVFIPPPFLGGAMHGDTVTVRILRRSAEGRAEGQVVRVLHRAHASIVGELHYAAGLAVYYVQPYDERLRERVLIPPGGLPPELRSGGGIERAERHRVLGTEARRPRPVLHARAGDPSLEGLVVDAEIVHYATPQTEAKGRVIEVLGRREDFGIDVEIMIRKYHLPHRFPVEVLADAEQAPAVLPAEEVAQRRDFRDLPIVTIDGETARDFDDAVFVRRRPNGDFELQVHIADVGHYVRAGSAMDREARLRGTSVYFPDRAVPMLPIELSTDLCSLRPQTERLVLSCIMEFSATGRLQRYELTSGIIRSAQRMTYTAVNAILSGSEPTDGSAGGADLPLMLELERVLNQRRRERGSIDFDLPEPEIAFDEFGLMRSIVKSERNVAHRIIEEFMLAANETVAGHLERHAVPALYRIHEKPDPRKVAEFEEVAASFGYTLNVAVPMRRIRRRVRGQIRVELVPSGEAVEITPRHYQRLIDQLAAKPEERIVSYLMLRSLQQARYSATNTGHFALAAPIYTHFTSPIRRYPDLLVHRVLKAILPPGGARMELQADGQWRPAAAGPAGAPVGPYEAAALQVMAAESSEAERRADEAERELMDWKKVRFMEERLGQQFAAMILHVTKAGFFVELVDLFIEGFVPLSALEDDRYVLRPGARELVGERSKRRYKLGDRLEVLVDRVDPIRHKIDFAPAQP